VLAILADDFAPLPAERPFAQEEAPDRHATGPRLKIRSPEGLRRMRRVVDILIR
jgi:hypothetical protein